MDTKDNLQAQHSFIFVHIPKTAGRSLLAALDAKFHCQHLRMADYIKRIGAEEVARRFKFTCVRNPWDRAASWYRFFHHRPHLKVQETTFDEWVIKSCKWNRTPLNQLAYVRSAAGEIMVDQFLQFENLESDYAKLRKTLGFLNPELPTVGMNEQMFLRDKLPENYQDYYQTDEARQAILDCNRELVDMFGYKF